MDWIRLNSGEWLAGELKGLRDLDLEFDSDELDLLKLDWDDVAGLRSPHLLSYRFDDDLGIYTGTAVMRDGIVTIQTGQGIVEQPRAKLLRIISGRQRERDYWSGNVSVGFVARSGNTDQTDLNALLRVRRETISKRFLLDYTGNLGKIGDSRSVNNHNLNVGVDALIRAGFFVTPLNVNLFHDEFQNIQLKTTVSAGVGYDALRGGDLEWSIGVGGGYQKTRYASVAEGEGESESTGSLIPQTELDWDVTPDLELVLRYNAQIGIPEVKNTYHHGQLVLSFDVLDDDLSIDLSLQWDRVETPRENADGDTPERDDFRTAFGIGLDF
jgi:putative salt-induced outer membrane protein YdiY